MKYLAINLNDSAIKTHAKDHNVSELRDVKNPICLRFHKSRDKATWCYFVNKGNTKQRTRLGYWPSLKMKDVVAMVPSIIEKLHHGKEVQSSNFKTVGELLTWYAQRTEKEMLKSKSRRKGVLSAIDKHLLPRLGSVSINAVRKQAIDEQLILPLQNQHLKPSTIRQYFAILKRVFASAKELELISVNPMAGMKFRDHVQRRIEPKQSRLLVDDAKGVLEQLVPVSESTRVMLLFMLMFATRIGETRQLRWSYIDLNSGLITLPETVTKTGVVHILPITTQAHEMLSEYKAHSRGDYLFGGAEPISSSAADKVVREVSKRKWSAHDLRKVARSVWATIGVDYWVAERLLNHKQKGLDLVYINADSMTVKRAALAQYHTWLFGSKPVLIPSMENHSEGENNNNYSKVA
tara:strand:+ start:1012 stop:2232 length:1221 start_codon:yes stop_codon:yes gene_type:complete